MSKNKSNIINRVWILKINFSYFLLLDEDVADQAIHLYHMTQNQIHYILFRILLHVGIGILNKRIF